jgi:hypothetical protein
MGGGDLDDVIALLAQRPGHRRVSVGRDMHDDDAHSEVLHLGDDLGEILFRADDDGVAGRAVPGQRAQVPVHLGLHALAPARANPAEPQLEPGNVSQRVVLRAAPSLDARLVPVTAQYRQAGAVA